MTTETENHTRLRTVADLVVATLQASGVRRIYGLPGD